MGNSSSSTAAPDVFAATVQDKLNGIAAEYITSGNFYDMVHLKEPEKCNNMVVITADTIESLFSFQEIEFLNNRTHDKQVVNNVKKISVAAVKAKDLIDRAKTTNERMGYEKRRMCIGIAELYIKIFHTFSAIKLTIDPTQHVGTPGRTTAVHHKDNRPVDYRRTNDRRADDRRVDDRRADDRRADERRMNEQRADDRRMDEQRADDRRADDRRMDEWRADERRADERRLRGGGFFSKTVQPVAPIAAPVVRVTANPENVCSTRLGILAEFKNTETATSVKKSNGFFSSSETTVSTDISYLSKSKSVCSTDTALRLRRADGKLPDIMGFLYNDKYDRDNGGFSGRTPVMESQYAIDSAAFYHAYKQLGNPLTAATGTTGVTPVTSAAPVPTFANIPANDYSGFIPNICSNGGLLDKTYAADKLGWKSTDDMEILVENKAMGYKANSWKALLTTYATHLKDSERRTQDHIGVLLTILDTMFEPTVAATATTPKQRVSIRKEISHAIVDLAMSRTRTEIQAMHLTCEKDFVKGLKLYEAIVETRYLMLHRTVER